MQPFTIVTTINRRDYVKLILKLTYRMPAMIWISIVAVVMLIGIALRIIGILPSSDNSGIYFASFFAPAILLMPMFIKMHAEKNYDRMPWLQKGIEYTFSDEGVNCAGIGFSKIFSWDQVVQKREMGNYLLLYVSKISAEILIKDHLSKEQIGYIKSKC